MRKWINVNTHGKMLSAFAYPKLTKHLHLKGQLSIAWQNQKTELDGFRVPVLFTTNCLMPPMGSYIADVFTSGLVRHPGTIHVDGGDFSPLIERALEKVS